MRTRRLTLLAALIAVASTTAQAQDIQAARDAYDQNRLAEARAGFAAVLRGQAAADEKAEATRGLARIAWIADGDMAAAEALLAPLILDREEGCRSLVMLVRFLREAELPQRAHDLSERRFGVCQEGQDRDQLIAHGALAAAHLDRAAAGPARRTGTRFDQLSPAGSLSSLVQTARLEAAVLGRDPDEAARAWSGFFWLEDGEALPAFGDVRPLFRAGLAEAAPETDREALADVLMRAGFTTAAETLLPETSAGPASERASTIRACTAFDRSVKALATEINRVMAKNPDSASLDSAAADLSNRLSDLYEATNRSIVDWPARKPTDGPIYAVNQRCNLVATFAFTGGYPGVHMGRLVRKEQRRLTDGGTATTTTFNLVDNMVVNGFQSWLWDGDKATGGWSGGGVVQVRGAYVRSALDAVALAFDPAERGRWESRQAALDASDRSRAADGSVVFLPGMAAQLRRQAIAQIEADAIGAGGDTARQLALRHFAQTLDRSIWVHEGRHSLDQARFTGDAALSGGDLEYRAKLSELALGRYPRDAFGAINNSLVGEDSAHGQGNTRVLTGYRDWISAHAEAIPGYDPDLPALMQIPKLSDDQIRSIAQGLLHDCCKDIVDLKVGPPLPQ